MRFFSFTVSRKIVCTAVLFGVGIFSAHGEETAVAVPLLASPINATWAANQGEEWYAKGFRGFLFEGLLDDLRLFPTEEARIQEVRRRAGARLRPEDNTAVLESVPDPVSSPPYEGGMVVPGDWEELTREILGANNRLHAAGLDRNFLHIRLAPEDAWFSDPLMLEIAERRFQLAGQLCHDAKLRGIAVDTQSDSFIYDYRWDGYAREVPAESLAGGAYQFGLRVLRAFIRACPGGEVLLLASRLESAGPLWFDLMKGFRDASGAVETPPIRLTFLEPAGILDWEFFMNAPALVSKVLEGRGAGREAQPPSAAPGLVFAFEPIHYEGAIPTPSYPLEDYRRALYAAAVYGAEYILIWSPEGGWWHIPPDLADQFQRLKQGGAARVRFAPPVPRTLDAYAPLLYDGMGTRIGALSIQGVETEVMKTGTGAALLLWDGTKEILRFPARTNMVAAVNLITEERVFYTPKKNTLTLPPLPGPVLLEGMPLTEYALPASIRLDTLSPIVAGIAQNTLEIGIRNPLAAPLRGTLAVLAGAHYALGAADFSLNLAPGERADYKRTLRGISRLGTRPDVAVSLTTASGAPLIRKFAFAVAPAERFHFFADGSPVGPPLLCSSPGKGAVFAFLGLDARGRLACFDMEACKVLWDRRTTGGYTRSPVMMADARGEPRVAVMNEQGRLRLFDLQGVEKLVLSSTAKQGGMLNTLCRNDGGGDLIVIAHDHRVSLYSTRGDKSGHFETSGRIHHVLTDAMARDILFVVVSPPKNPEEKGPGDKKSPAAGVTRRLCALNPRGEALWDASFARGISCRPVIVADEYHGQSQICVGDFDGGITCLDAEKGSLVDTRVGKGAGAVLQMAGTYHPTSGCVWIFYLEREAIRACPLAGRDTRQKLPKAWTVGIRYATALAALPFGEGVVVGTADGSAYALNLSGQLLWEDHDSPGAVTGLTFSGNGVPVEAYTCILSTACHSVRGLEIRRRMLSEAPLLLDPLSPPE